MSCTNSPNGDFNHCCQEHDAYYADGSLSRWDADKKFFFCILNANDRSFINQAWHTIFVAPVYWLGVRLFGKKHYKNKAD